MSNQETKGFEKLLQSGEVSQQLLRFFNVSVDVALLSAVPVNTEGDAAGHFAEIKNAKAHSAKMEFRRDNERSLAGGACGIGQGTKC